MKRILSLFLALLAVTLSSCSTIKKTPQDGSTNNHFPGQSDEDDDFIKDEFGFAKFPEGNYLADKKFDTDEYLPDYDADNNFILLGNYGPGGGGICSTDDTIYYFSESEDMQYCLLMYRDKVTGISAPLCGKPECLHNNKNCNAYVEGSSTFLNGLYIYGDMLYWISRKGISSVNLDGTNRAFVRGLNSKLFVPVGGITNSAVMHRGYIYYFSVDQQVTDSKQYYYLKVAAEPIDGCEDGFVIMTRSLNNPICQLRFAGNDVYIMIGETERREDGDAIGVMELCRWDSKTRKGEILYKGALDDEENVSFDEWFRDFVPIPGDGIYLYKKYSRFEEDGSYVYNSGLCKYSFETGEIEHITWLDGERGEIDFVKDSRIYSTYFGTVNISDFEGNLIAQSAQVESRSFGEAAGIDDDYIYFLNNGGLHDNYEAVPLDGGDSIILD